MAIPVFFLPACGLSTLASSAVIVSVTMSRATFLEAGMLVVSTFCWAKGRCSSRRRSQANLRATLPNTPPEARYASVLKPCPTAGCRSKGHVGLEVFKVVGLGRAGYRPRGSM
ncbi:unnamed protein product [Ectocarpus sp. 4 AP-2014]